MKKNYKRSIYLLTAILVMRAMTFAQNWSPVGGGIYGQVLAMAVYNGELYIGGSFGSTSTIAASRIVKWNGSTWSAVGTGMNNDVLSLAVFNGELYAGGRFTTAGGVSANRIAKWNGTAWSAVGTGAGMDDRVRALVADTVNNVLYAGGDFTTADGVTANTVAKWNGTSWSGIGVTSPGTVESLSMYGGNLYAGVNMVSGCSNIAAYNGSTWSATGLGNGLGASLTHALYTFNNELYLGGDFRTAGSNTYTTNYVAKFNGTGFDSLSCGMDTVGIPAGTAGSGAGVRAFAVLNNEIYAGGEFTSASRHSAKFMAKWNGTTWDSVNTGMNNIVRALGTYNGELYAGGNFTTAGGITAYYIAKLSSGTTGVESHSKPKNIRVYPNPATNHLTIKMDESIQDVSIYDSLGEEVQKEATDSFSIAHLPAGIYILKIYTGTNVSVTRFIKE